jgi:hypothetical protein
MISVAGDTELGLGRGLCLHKPLGCDIRYLSDLKYTRLYDFWNTSHGLKQYYIIGLMYR